MIAPRSPPPAYSSERSQQRAADARRLVLGQHDEQRQAPHALAVERERGADHAPVVLGHPGAAGIALEQLLDPHQRGHQRRRRRRRLVEAPVEVGEGHHRDLVDREVVLAAHGADGCHGGQPYASRQLAELAVGLEVGLRDGVAIGTAIGSAALPLAGRRGLAFGSAGAGGAVCLAWPGGTALAGSARPRPSRRASSSGFAGRGALRVLGGSRRARRSSACRGRADVAAPSVAVGCSRVGGPAPRASPWRGPWSCPGPRASACARWRLGAMAPVRRAASGTAARCRRGTVPPPGARPRCAARRPSAPAARRGAHLDAGGRAAADQRDRHERLRRRARRRVAAARAAAARSREPSAARQRGLLEPERRDAPAARPPASCAGPRPRSRNVAAARALAQVAAQRRAPQRAAAQVRELLADLVARRVARRRGSRSARCGPGTRAPSPSAAGTSSTMAISSCDTSPSSASTSAARWSSGSWRDVARAARGGPGAAATSADRCSVGRLVELVERPLAAGAQHRQAAVARDRVEPRPELDLPVATPTRSR